MLWTLRAAVLVLTVNVGVASAAQGDEERLYELSEHGRSVVGLNAVCRSRDPDYLDNCYLVVSSALAVHRIMVANHPELAAYCPRREASIEEARLAFLRWYGRALTAKDPDQRMGLGFMPGAVGVIAALREESPCFR